MCLEASILVFMFNFTNVYMKQNDKWHMKTPSNSNSKVSNAERSIKLFPKGSRGEKENFIAMGQWERVTQDSPQTNTGLLFHFSESHVT